MASKEDQEVVKSVPEEDDYSSSDDEIYEPFVDSEASSDSDEEFREENLAELLLPNGDKNYYKTARKFLQLVDSSEDEACECSKERRAKKSVDLGENKAIHEVTCPTPPAAFSGSLIEEGKAIEIQVVKSWPRQNDLLPFELVEMARQYEEMEEKMEEHYKKLEKGVKIRKEYASKYDYAVHISYVSDMKPKFRRIKIRNVASFQHLEDNDEAKAWKIFVVKAELIDYGSRVLVDNIEDICQLDESFGVLPPRVIDIKLEWMSYYKSHELYRRFVRMNSDEFLFSGKLTAKKQASGDFLVWSEDFPEDKFPNGINGFIVESIIEEMKPTAFQLPTICDSKREVYIVHADQSGHVYIQFNNVITTHCYEICQTFDPKEMIKLCGSVTLPLNPSQMYLAPHHVSDGSFYRCVPLSPSEATEEKVEVLFIDYGDTACLKLQELVKVEAVHPLAAIFPPLAVKTHLENIWSLKPYQFLCFKGVDRSPYTLHLTQSPTEKDPPEVILWDTKNKCLNKRIVYAKLGEPVDPLLDYSQVPHFASDSHQWWMKPKLYLGLGGGKRLRKNDVLEVLMYLQPTTMKKEVFILPTYRSPKLDELEDLIDRYCTHLTDEYELTRDPGLPSYCMRPGKLVLCRSGVLGKYVRAVLIGEVKENVSAPGNKKEICWEIYLFDYGVFDVVPLAWLFPPMPDHNNLPALGVRALPQRLIKKFKDIEEFEKWTVDIPIVKVRVLEIRKDTLGEVVDLELLTDKDSCKKKRVTCDHSD